MKCCMFFNSKDEYNCAIQQFPSWIKRETQYIGALEQWKITSFQMPSSIFGKKNHAVLVFDGILVEGVFRVSFCND